MHTILSWLRNFLGFLLSLGAPSEPPPRALLEPPSRAPYAQMHIQISSLRIDINNEICTMPTGTGHVSIVVDPESVPQALITSDTALASDTTSVWPTLDSECFELDVRPSSRLLFTLHEGRSSESTQHSFFALVAELFAGISDDGSCTYESRNQDGKLLFRSTLTLVIKSYPQYSRPTSKESSDRIPSDSTPQPYRLFHLTDEKHKFSDMFSWEVGVTLSCAIIFLHRHSQGIPALSKTFLWSTMSVFWRITQDLGPYQPQSSLTDPSQTDIPPTTPLPTPASDHRLKYREEVPSGGEYPLRNIVFQMNFLLRMPIPDGPGKDDLLLAIRRELCLCVAVLEAHIESYRDITWMKACLADQARTFVDRQRELFLLGCKCALLTHKGEQYDKSFGDRKQIIERILSFAVEESLNRQDSEYDQPESKKSREGRPFTTVVSSARGSQCDNVWNIAFEILQKEEDQNKRRVYRRILTEVVQAADRIPGSLWVGNESDQCDLIVNRANSLSPEQGGFASVYKSRTYGQDVAIKCLQVPAKGLADINYRRKLYLEIVSWKTLRHPHLLPLVGVCRARLQAGEILSELCMVSPYMGKGTLRSYYATIANDVSGVQTDPRPFDLVGRMRHIRQVASGMAYLHGEGMAHGGLRGENIFIDDHGDVQIDGFEFCVPSTYLSLNDYSMLSGYIRWIAPELVAPERYNQTRTVLRRPPEDEVVIGRSTKEGDVFSFSSVCIEVFSGNPPFQELSNYTILNKIYEGTLDMPPRPLNMGVDTVWTLVADCRRKSAAERPTFRNIQGTLRRSELSHTKEDCCNTG